jgi:hypothetical protein
MFTKDNGRLKIELQ